MLFFIGCPRVRRKMIEWMGYEKNQSIKKDKIKKAKIDINKSYIFEI